MQWCDVMYGVGLTATAVTAIAVTITITVTVTIAVTITVATITTIATVTTVTAVTAITAITAVTAVTTIATVATITGAIATIATIASAVTAITAAVATITIAVVAEQGGQFSAEVLFGLHVGLGLCHGLDLGVNGLIDFEECNVLRFDFLIDFIGILFVGLCEGLFHGRIGRVHTGFVRLNLNSRVGLLRGSIHAQERTQRQQHEHTAAATRV